MKLMLQVHTMAVGRSYLYSSSDDLMIKAWNLHDLTLHTSVEVSTGMPCVAFVVWVLTSAFDFYSWSFNGLLMNGDRLRFSSGVSSFLTAHQHIIGSSVEEENCRNQVTQDCSRWMKHIRDDWWLRLVWVGEWFFWYRLTWIVPDKIHGAVKRLFVCVMG